MTGKAQKAREFEDFRTEETFHSREWRIQRIGWAILSMLVAAALTGVFGSGPLAHRVIASSAGVVELERFIRNRSGTVWSITPRSTGGNTFAIRIGSAFLAHYKITAIVPEPRRRSLSGSDITFEFDVVDPSAAIVFHVEAERFGFNEGSLRLSDAEPARIWQLIYP